MTLPISHALNQVYAIFFIQFIILLFNHKYLQHSNTGVIITLVIVSYPVRNPLYACSLTKAVNMNRAHRLWRFNGWCLAKMFGRIYVSNLKQGMIRLFAIMTTRTNSCRCYPIYDSNFIVIMTS